MLMYCDLWPKDLSTTRNFTANSFWLNFQFVNEDLLLKYVDTNNQAIFYKYFHDDVVNSRNSSKIKGGRKLNLMKVLLY